MGLCNTKVHTEVAEEASPQDWHPRHELRRTTRRETRHTTRLGRLVSEHVTETATVTDHLQQLHSARVAHYERGSLVSEAAVLYIPAGLAAKAVTGTAAASMAVGAAGAAAMAGALGSMAGALGGGPPADGEGAPAAIGYANVGGKVTWGVLRHPEALGLPRQRRVGMTAVEHVRPPPWQSPQPPHTPTPSLAAGSGQAAAAKTTPQPAVAAAT